MHQLREPRKLWTTLLCLSAALAISSTDVFGQHSHFRLFDPTYADWELPAIPSEGGICRFPVRGHFLRANVYNQFYFDGDTLIKVKFEGNAVIELINVNTGQSVVRSISGPGEWDPATNLVDASGPWLQWFAFDDPYWKTTIVGLWYHTGHLVLDLSGPIGQLSKRIGKWENICETLAPQ